MLGIELTDLDIFDVPLLRTDAYGNFIPGLTTGFAQVITGAGADGILNTSTTTWSWATLARPSIRTVAGALRTGHAFLNDIAHNAVPGTLFDPDGPGGSPAIVVGADTDTVAGNTIATDFAGRKVAYDDELLDAHFITGDGRGNENIGLTSVHFVFHAEHNRLVEHIKDVVNASNDPAFIAEWKLPDGSWNGERLFQAARFGTEMQYQHLVFEEFARKVQPQVDVFLAEGQGYDSTINPAIVAEFAHVVYRFGHSMLTETVDRFDPNFDVISNPNGLDPEGQQMGLIAAFLNPLAFAQTVDGAPTLTDVEGASAIIRGVTRQAGNEIDEFVTEALRNNLVGLPLDLPAINLARGRDAGVPTLNQARAEFYLMAGGDSQLKPYTSWADYASNLKHPESLVNFIAAYGTHTELTAADVDTIAEKRAVAFALVMGGSAVINAGTGAERTFTADLADRLAFLNGTGTYANLASGATTTGVDAIDLWIGGLAEKQMPFGGLLGSTFNFVFETQMEKLQNGDRFYYLERTAGLNFLTELENNSFAKLIMANTNVTHLPGDVFSTPAYTLEVNDAVQFTGLGPEGRDDPTEGGTALTPLVIRNDPNTVEPNPNYLQYTGTDHVVLGGTAGNDTLIASIGDDTLHGDGGNDRLEGGDGVDMIFGGAGDDIITDKGGDDILQGQDGNDAIHGGNGLDLILGGFGHDFIVIGEDGAEAFGGPGNDFILSSKPVEMTFGNEGDDWIERGMADGSAGENFDMRGLDSIIGNDVFMGDTVSDRMGGEGGDDIMIGNGGTGDRYLGASGFDWAVFTHPTLGATADLNLRAFDATPIPPSQVSVLARFESVEGLSGSAFADILRGDDLDAAGIALSGFNGSVLANIGLINGLQGFLDTMIGDGVTPVTSFGAGNIILGGAGSDIIEGRGGNDLIDGDKWLNVQIGVYAQTDTNHTGTILSRHDSMTELTADVFAGKINPGQLGIVREIKTSLTTDFDTAVYAGSIANYDVVDNLDGTYTVTDNVGLDGVDTLANIERLQFADAAVNLVDGINSDPEGIVFIDNEIAPTEDQLLTVTAELLDANNITAANPFGEVTGSIAFFWQVELRPVAEPGVFEDIVIATGVGDQHATGPTFTPGDDEVGLRLRVRAVYQDAAGVLETVFSAPTAAVANVNDAPVITGNLVSDTTPTETQPLTALTGAITDADGLTAPGFTFQWLVATTTGPGASGFTGIAGATAQTFTPTPLQVNRELRVAVTYTDDQGTVETVTSPATTVTGDFVAANGVAQTLLGTEGQDIINGGGGADIISGFGENDIIDGGTGIDSIAGGAGNDTIAGGDGNDMLNGDAGNDIFNYVIGDDADAVNGGARFRHAQHHRHGGRQYACRHLQRHGADERCRRHVDGCRDRHDRPARRRRHAELCRIGRGGDGRPRPQHGLGLHHRGRYRERHRRHRQRHADRQRAGQRVEGGGGGDASGNERQAERWCGQ